MKRKNETEEMAAGADDEIDTYLETLVAVAKTDDVRKKLRGLHAACREIVGRGRELTIPLVMSTYDKVTDEVIGESTIRNKRSGANPYNSLFLRWRRLAADRVPAKRVNLNQFGVASYVAERLNQINDVNLQHHVTLLLAKNRSLEQQLNILKKERTDVPLRVEASAKPNGNPGSQLFDGEVEALINFFDPRSLKARGMKAGLDGSVVLKDGRVLSDPGFIQALKKVVRIRKEEE